MSFDSHERPGHEDGKDFKRLQRLEATFRDLGLNEDVRVPMDQTAGKMRSILAPERIERLKRLELIELELDPEYPEESPHLKEIERLYTANLIPDAALLALDYGDADTFYELTKRGGMLNRFDPSPAERELYTANPDDYESVKAQIINDMVGDRKPDMPKKRPGRYRIFGLVDPAERKDEGWLQAYVSMRFMPQDDPEERERYVRHLQSVLVGDRLESGKYSLIEDGTMNVINKQWDVDRMINTQIGGGWAEIDTINVRAGAGGAAFPLLHKSLQRIKEEGQPMPTGFFCYRFDGLIMSRSHDDYGHQPANVGANTASEDLFMRRLRFTRFAIKADDNERVVRQIPPGSGEVHIYSPYWLYMYSGPNNLQKSLERNMREMGLQ